MSKDAEIIVYSGDYCPFCKEVISFLKSKDFQNINIIKNDEKEFDKFFADNPNLRTIPQVVINGKLVPGGCSGVKSAYEENQLANFLDNSNSKSNNNPKGLE